VIPATNVPAALRALLTALALGGCSLVARFDEFGPEEAPDAGLDAPVDREAGPLDAPPPLDVPMTLDAPPPIDVPAPLDAPVATDAPVTIDARICAPSTAECASLSARRVCRPDGSGFDESACPTGQTCEAGACAVRCGDGIVGTGETCDDGNTASGDGCSSSCAREAPPGYVRIVGSTFTMGSPTSELGRNADEGPVSVTLTHDFFMKVTEVTQAEWRALSGGVNPACFQSSTATVCTSENANDEGPVERIDWYSALGYANALSTSEGLSACYLLSGCADPSTGWQDGVHTGCSSVAFAGLDCLGYRLPTEAEWEFAARASTSGATYLGDLIGSPTDCLNPQPAVDSIAWWCGNAGGRTHTVATRDANAWGLYDMLGNVWEWTWDRYDVTLVSGVDPTGSGSGARRVQRGGSWLRVGADVRSAVRGNNLPDFVGTGDGFGLRLVRTVP
jgi:cysteine-rich repeat protein